MNNMPPQDDNNYQNSYGDQLPALSKQSDFSVYQVRATIAIIFIIIILGVAGALFVVSQFQEDSRTQESESNEKSSLLFTDSFPLDTKDSDSTTAIWDKYGIQLPVEFNGNFQKIIELKTEEYGRILGVLDAGNVFYTLYYNFDAGNVTLSAYSAPEENLGEIEEISRVLIEDAADMEVISYLVGEEVHVAKIAYDDPELIDFSVYRLNQQASLELYYSYEMIFPSEYGYVSMEQISDLGESYIAAIDQSGSVHLQRSSGRPGKLSHANAWKKELNSSLTRAVPVDVTVSNSLVYILGSDNWLRSYTESDQPVSEVYIPQAFEILATTDEEIYVVKKTGGKDSGISVVDTSDPYRLVVSEENILPPDLYPSEVTSGSAIELYVDSSSGNRYMSDDNGGSFFLVGKDGNGFPNIQKMLEVTQDDNDIAFAASVSDNGAYFPYHEVVYYYNDWISISNEISLDGYHLQTYFGPVGFGINEECTSVAVFDLRDISNVSVMNTIALPESVWSCTIDMSPDNRFLTLSDNRGLLLYDISDLVNPKYFGIIPEYYNENKVSFDDQEKYVYYLDKDVNDASTYYLDIVDISDPTNITKVVSKQEVFEHLSDAVLSVDVYQDRLYVLTGDIGSKENALHILDVSNLQDIKVVSRGMLGATKLYIENGYAWMFFPGGTEDYFSSPTLASAEINDLYNLAQFQPLSQDSAFEASAFGIDFRLPYATLFDTGYFVFSTRYDKWHVFSTIDPKNVVYVGEVDVAQHSLPDMLFDNKIFNWNGMYTTQLYSFPYSLDKKIAQSKRLNDSGDVIDKATLKSVDYIPLGTSIEYHLSNTGGRSWELVQNNEEHEFISSGNDLRFKVILSTNNSVNSPKIYSLEIDY